MENNRPQRGERAQGSAYVVIYDAVPSRKPAVALHDKKTDKRIEFLHLVISW